MRSSITPVVLVTAIAACSSSSSPSTTRLTLDNDGASVAIDVAIPSSWRSNGSPGMFESDDARIMFVAISPRGDTPAARVDRAVEMQFAVARPEGRVDFPDGRAWVSRVEAGDTVHSRLFVPYADGVVMGVGHHSPSSKDAIVELRRVFETIVVR